MPFLGKTPTKFLDANVNIDGGNIDGTTIGAASAASATVTTFTSTGIDDNATSTAITIDSSENVGIGETTPSTTLTKASITTGLVAEGTVPGFCIQDTSGADNAGYWFQENGTMVLQNYGTGNTVFRTGSSGTETVRIDSSGKVGIGTTSPSNVLHVSATGLSTPALIQSTSTVARIAFQDVNTTDSNTVRIGSAGDDMSFLAGGSEAMRIDSSGNVGIGTSTINSGFVVDLGSLTVPAAGASTSCAMFGNSGSNGLYGTQIGALSTGTGYIQVQRADGTASTYDLLLQPNGGNVGIGTTSPSATLDLVGPSSTPVVLEINSANSNCDVTMQSASTSTATRLRNGTNDFQVHTNGTERMRIDSSGKVFIGKTSDNDNTAGHTLHSSGLVVHTRDSSFAAIFNRTTDDGDIVQFKQDGTTVGSIGNFSSGLEIQNGANYGLLIISADTGVPRVLPRLNYGVADNVMDLGDSGSRYDDIYATNGTIQTSDVNEKQDIEALSEAEQRVAVAAKALLRKFRWKSAVRTKSHDARIHFGIIAQDLQAAFEAEGLDAGEYGMFTHSTWTDEETGEERSRMGVRYSELLAFIIAAI